MGKAKAMDLGQTNIAGLGTDLEKQCRISAGDTEKAWAGVGEKPGLKVWRIENFKVQPWPEKEYGKFYSGDSYIVINSYQKPKQPKLYHDIHFWLGLETTQDEAGTAAYKAVELDDYLGGIPVQHREVQGSESPLFLSYFKFFVVESGGIDSGFEKVKPETYRPRLLHIYSPSAPPVAGRPTKSPLIIREVPLTHKSLNSGDVFVLDKGLDIFQWNGSKSSGIERAKAAEFVRTLDAERKGKATVTVFEEGDAAEAFWEGIGGKGEVAPPIDYAAQSKVNFEKVLYRLSDASGKTEFTLQSKGVVRKSDFDSKDVFVFDTGLEVLVWVGKESNRNERALAMQHAMEYVKSHKRPLDIPITRVVEGGDTAILDASLDP